MANRLYKIALFAERHYRGIFLAAALLVGLSLVLASRLEFDADVLSLLPEHDPVVKTFRDTLAEFGGLDLLLVIIKLPEDPVLGPYQELANRIGPELEKLPEMEWVDYRIGKPDELLRAFFPKSFLFLDEEGRRLVAERLSEEGMRQQAQELRRMLTTPKALAFKELALLDPLGLSQLFLYQMTGGSGALGVDWTSGNYVSRDHRLLLILAKPIRPPQDIGFTTRLMADVEALCQRVRDENWGEIAAPGMERPEILLGGGYLTALEDASLIKKDILINAAGSMVLVLLLFLFAFRRLGLLLYAFLPLSCGLVLAFGFAGATTGVLSSATSGFAALLIGLGIDFVIVSYGRFVEERHRGRSSTEALAKMTGHCGRAVVIGGVTSAATFYAFAVTEFTGLRQMGILTGTGILLCMISVLLLLPAMLAWSEVRHRRRDTSPSLYLHGFGAHRLVRFSVARPRLVLWSGVVLTAIAIFLLPHLHFESSIRNMRPKGHRGFLMQDLVAEHFGSNFEYMMLVLRGETVDEVLDLAGRATAGALPMVEDGTLRSVESITRLIPPPESQREVLEWIAAERRDLLDPAKLRQRFTRALTEAGLRVEPFEEGLQLLLQAANPSKPIGVDDLRGVEGTERLLERYLRPSKDGGWVGVVYLHAPPRIWKREPPPQAEVLAAELGPNVVLTGTNVVSRNLRRQVWKDAVVACVLGTVLVAFLLWLDFRRLGDTLLSLVPLMTGVLWMLGAMVALGIDMNFMNIFVTTMIIGIGVDYGVHMLHRHRELREASLAELTDGLGETGKAIIMAAVSTIVGFGSLVLSHYPGLRSIGSVAILGAVSTSLVAITLLPAYLTLARRQRVRESAGEALAAVPEAPSD